MVDLSFSPKIYIACRFMTVNRWCNVTSHIVLNVT